VATDKHGVETRTWVADIWRDGAWHTSETIPIRHEPTQESPAAATRCEDAERARIVRALRNLDPTARDEYRAQDVKRKRYQQIKRDSQITVDVIPGSTRFNGEMVWLLDTNDKPSQLATVKQMYLDGSMQVVLQ